MTFSFSTWGERHNFYYADCFYIILQSTPQLNWPAQSPRSQLTDPTNTRLIPKAVNLRIGKLSANEKIFKESSKKYIDALKNSGFKEDFRYLKENITNEITKDNNNYDQKNKNRKRKIIWFNPPFCKLANIDVGKYFLRLIDKHFKQDNILHKIFNRKTLKISYSCTKNISQIINSHNNELINKFHNRVNNNNINSKKK